MQNYKKLTDEELVASYARGDNAAFDELLSRHKTKLFDYILRIVHDRDLADDIFQETFVKAIVTIRQGRYKDFGKFSAWIARIARNLAIDSFRAEKSDAEVSADNADYDLLNRRELSDGTIEDTLIDMQIEDDLRNLVDCLPEEQQRVLKMRYYSDMSFKDIAEHTGVSINTSLGRMRYAILNLRRMAKERQLELSR